MNVKNIFFLLAVGLLCGCTTISGLERRYSRVSFEDGIDAQEARVIAQKEYLKLDSYRDYKVGSATIYDSDNVLTLNRDKNPFVDDEHIYTEYKKKLKFDDSWFITFRPKFLSFFSVYYLIVVDKKSGEVQYTRDSNALADVVQFLFTNMFKPKVTSALAISMYYRDTKEMPDNSEQLKKYLDQLPQETKTAFKLPDDFKIEKISANRLKVTQNIQPSEIGSVFPEIDQSLNTKEYEIEIREKDDKLLITGGAVKMEMKLIEDSQGIRLTNQVSEPAGK